MAVKAKSTKVTDEKPIEKAVEKRRDKRSLKTELRKKKDDIVVEIANISPFNCYMALRSGEELFDLYPGDYTELTLDEVKQVVDRCKGFFSDYSLQITDVFNDEYSLTDILEYLNLTTIYKNVEGFDEDFLEKMLVEEDTKNFAKIVDRKDYRFAMALACKGVYMNNSDDFDFELSRAKENILCDKLGRDELILK